MQRRRSVTQTGIFLPFFAFLFLYRYGLSEQNIFVCEGELIISDDKKNII